MQYVGQDGTKHPEFLVIDRQTLRGESRITKSELDAVLRNISSTPGDFSQMLQAKSDADWRFDFVPFRSRPLIEVQTDKLFCSDLGLLVEKMHSGIYWAINEGLSREERPRLFKAWGILFEEYVNWFLKERRFNEPTFWASPKWPDGTESFDGALLKDSRFMPFEYKGGFLQIKARYSASQSAFQWDLERKIVEGCRQLAWKIELLFNKDAGKRRSLPSIPLDHITRIVPVLVVQDHILRGPLIDWWLNKKFAESLDRSALRAGLTVESLNVVGIYELETMVESSEAGIFDMFHGLQLKCYSDPGMRAHLHNFLLTVPGYGKGVSERIDRVLDELFEEMNSYLFAARCASR